jgi:hypothetical protein
VQSQFINQSNYHQTSNSQKTMALSRPLSEDVVDLAADADEASGEIVKNMRIGQSTISNYRSGMKQIIQYLQKQERWKHLVKRDVDNPGLKFPFVLDIPVPLAALKSAFGF